MTNRLGWVANELEELDRLSLRRLLTTRESPPLAAMIQIDGRQFINFGSNDYLGLAASAELVQAVQHAVSQLGVGSGSSPLISGRGTLHRRLERELAKFEATESALLFPTGYAANVGTITALAGEGDIIFSDQLNHASIIDGCRLSKAETKIYAHCDLDQLSQELSRASSFRRRLIVTDGLFSMDGDFAPLPELCELADQFDAMLMVDEAHATGVFGQDGRGCCEMFAVEDRVDVRIGTLGKAIGVCGGFVAGPEQLIQWIFNKARTQFFSTAMPEMLSAASLAALKLVIDQPHRRGELRKASSRLRQQLSAAGLDIGQSQSQIIPIIVGDSQRAASLAADLRERGIFVSLIRYPTVARDRARLRVSLSWSHSEDQIDQLLNSLVLAVNSNSA